MRGNGGPGSKEINSRMIIAELRIYEFLTKELKLGEDIAKRYVQEIVQVEVKLEQQIETKVEKQLGSAKDTIILRLEAKISETKVDLIKWMVSLIVGLLVTQMGITITIVKFHLNSSTPDSHC